MDCSLEGHSGYLQALMFLRDTFRFDDVVGMTTNKRIHSAVSDWNFQLVRTVIFGLCFADWYALFGVLLNPAEKDRVGMKMESGSILKELNETGMAVKSREK
jgi:hypothetical protein